MNAALPVYLIISFILATLIVVFSPAMLNGESELLQPAFCLQILSVVASIGFAVVAFIFPILLKAIDSQDNARRIELEGVKKELQEDVMLLFILVVVVFFVGLFRELDLPVIQDMFCLKKSAIISWCVLESFLLSAIGIFDLVFTSFQIMHLSSADEGRKLALNEKEEHESKTKPRKHS